MFVLYYLSKQYCVREIPISLITALYLDINDHIIQRTFLVNTNIRNILFLILFKNMNKNNTSADAALLVENANV